MADAKKASLPKSAAPVPPRRKRKQQQRRRRRPPVPQKEEAAAEGGEGGQWPPPPPPPPPFPAPEWEGGEGPWAAPERGGRARGRAGKKSRGGSRGRRGRGRAWGARGGGSWGPPGMEEGPPPEWEGRGGPWGPPEGDGGGPWGGPGEGPWDDWERRGPPGWEGRPPWGPAEEDMGAPPWGPPGMEGGGPPPEWEGRGGGGPWGPPEMDAGPPPGRGVGGPWGPPEEGMGGRPWGPSEMGERPPPERGGGGGRWAPPEREIRERSWGPPERNGRGPPKREGREPPRGSPERVMSPARELWAPPQEGLWRGLDSEMLHRSGPPSSLGWEPHRGDLRSRWGSPIEEARQELRGQGPVKPWRARSESPAEGRERSHPPEKLRRIQWDGPEGREGEQVPPGRSLERLRKQQDPNRPWRDGSRDHSYPARHQLQQDGMGIGGQWSGPEEMERELSGPPREEWGWDSPSRPRCHTGEARDHYSPTWEEGREHFRGQNPPDLDQGCGTLGGGRWNSLEQRGRGHLSQYDGDSAIESPNRQQHPEGFEGEWGPRGDRVDRGIDRDWKKEEEHGGGEVDFSAQPSAADPATVPKEWTPCEQVLGFWARCRTVLRKKPHGYMLSTCPRPTLPDRSSETPELNASVSAMLKPHQQKEIASATRSLRSVQDEVLDMLGPAMTIYEMAEEALAKGEAVDPMELREWARRLVRYIGSINQNLTLQRRVVVLGAIHPRLKCVTTKMTSQSTDGLLFAEDKVKLLKEIIKRFPQLAQTPQASRRAQPFLRPSYSRRRAPVRSSSRHLHSAGEPYRRSPANHHEEEHH